MGEENLEPKKDDGSEDNSGDGGQDGGGAGQKDTDDGQGGDNNDDQGKKDDNGQSQNQEGEDDEPPVRKTKVDFIKERLERKKAKSQAKDANDDDGNGDGDDDGEISPEDEELIDKVIKKRYGKVFENIEAEKEAQADREEATQFFEASPEFKPYQAKILKWWGDPTRRHLPIETVALEAVGYKNLIKLGAQKERVAANKAKETGTPGGDNSGDNGGQKSISDMSDAEIRELNLKVISNRPR